MVIAMWNNPEKVNDVFKYQESKVDPWSYAPHNVGLYETLT